MTKEQSKEKIQKLVHDFKNQNGWKESEEHIQSSFTLKLLEILGWDSSNWTINTGQEIKTGKKPDIILKNEGSKLLVIESKEASKKDKLDGKYINQTFEEQLFHYCDAEGLEWGVLTNFVEWRIYSVHHKRLYKRKLAFYGILWDGANKADYLDLLSDEGLSFLELISKKYLTDKNGHIDDDPIYYAQQEDIKKEFFEKIKKWRASLRSYISKNFSRDFNNDQERIDVAAQRIIDRMIFMDICHDKKVINENHIRSVLQSKKLKYDELKEKFRKMDEKFNTELFAEDECDQIKISDEIIVSIIKELEEIDFSKLSVHVIGEVYENYLGELAKSNVKKEETKKAKQKQKRKSQGIYYTPDYIVDYIVKNTVGEILKNCKTEKEIEKIRVLDPACGSGSFLIRAFDEFYDAYQRVHRRQEGFIFEVKKKILQKNLFGVDLDPKAVEITKLNLMIKALEGVKPKHLHGKHLLPNLNLNIRCGNSLIGGEVIADKQEKVTLFDTYELEIDALSKLKDDFYHAFTNQDKKALLKKIEEKEEFINNNHTFGLNRKLKTYFRNLEKIKPFNYSVAFAEVMRDGGFDAVIGNPPYITLSLGKKQKFFTGGELEYFDQVSSVSAYKGNTYALFIEKASNILKKDGLFSFIIPNTILLSNTFKKARKYILDRFSIKVLINITDKVFGDAETGGNLVFVFEKNNKISDIMVGEVRDNSLFDEVKLSRANKEDYLEDPDNRFFVSNVDLGFIKKIHKQSIPLGQIVDFYQGIITGDNKKFLSDQKTDERYEKIIRGKDINRYSLEYANKYVLFDKKKLWSNTNENFFKAKEKIINRQTADGLIGVYDDQQYFTLDSTHVQVLKDKKYNLKFLLALFNSKLLNYIYKRNVEEVGRTFAQVKVVNLKTLPIKKIETKEEKEIYKKIIVLADEMLKLNKTPESREKNQTKIKALDYEIDQLVYKLYGLTKDEIKIIEKDGQ